MGRVVSGDSLYPSCAENPKHLFTHKNLKHFGDFVEGLKDVVPYNHVKLVWEEYFACGKHLLGFLLVYHESDWQVRIHGNFVAYHCKMY